MLDLATPTPRRLSHDLVARVINEGDTVVDATLGNGHDCEFLATLVGQTGCVIGFDIQDAAITATKLRLARAGLASRVTLVNACHALLGSWFAHNLPGISIKAAMFNLGYLPGSDKSVVTIPESTLAALAQALAILAPGGMLTIVVYPGHPGGERETSAVLAWARSLPRDQASVFWYQTLNQPWPTASLVAVERK